MAYDNFENTPFDLNHDGHIDSNEAAYIYDTFYNEDNTDESDLSGSYSGGGYSSYRRSSIKRSPHTDQVMENIRNGRLPSGKTMEELEREVRLEPIRKKCILWALGIFVGGFIFGQVVTGIVIAAILLFIGLSIK